MSSQISYHFVELIRCDDFSFLIEMIKTKDMVLLPCRVLTNFMFNLVIAILSQVFFFLSVHDISISHSEVVLSLFCFPHK